MIDLDIFSQGAIAALVQVIMIDLVLAGDNAVVIGLAAAGLPPEQRSRAILVGIIAATVLRIAFASIAVELLEIVGLLLAGGILLLWVCWKMWRELRGPGHKATEAALSVVDGKAPHKTFAQAAWQIVIADISMSLDNVQAVRDRAAEKLGVNSTPTFFINGKRLTGDQSIEAMAKEIDPYLKEG